MGKSNDEFAGDSRWIQAARPWRARGIMDNGKEPHIWQQWVLVTSLVWYVRTLYVANLGDSRVVLGKKFGSTGEVAAIQLSTEHNADEEAVRQELKAQHPNDPQIVMLKDGVWRVKGIIQVSRSIGDAYMKHAQLNREPINPKFRISGPMNMPILSAHPSIISHELHRNDSFLTFASDGLWEHLSNDKAVEIVYSNPHTGSAKRLIKAALQEAARKREMRYSDLRGTSMEEAFRFKGGQKTSKTVLASVLFWELIDDLEPGIPSIFTTWIFYHARLFYPSFSFLLLVLIFGFGYVFSKW